MYSRELFEKVGKFNKNFSDEHRSFLEDVTKLCLNMRVYSLAYQKIRALDKGDYYMYGTLDRFMYPIIWHDFRRQYLDNVPDMVSSMMGMSRGECKDFSVGYEESFLKPWNLARAVTTLYVWGLEPIRKEYCRPDKRKGVKETIRQNYEETVKNMIKKLHECPNLDLTKPIDWEGIKSHCDLNLLKRVVSRWEFP